MDNWRPGYESANPSPDDIHIPAPLPRVNDEELVEVYNAEDDFAFTTRCEEDDDLFDAHDDDC